MGLCPLVVNGPKVRSSRRPVRFVACLVVVVSAGSPSPEIVDCAAADVPSCDLLGMMFSDTPAGSEALARWVTEIGMVPAPAPGPGTNARYTDAAAAYWAQGIDYDAITNPVLAMNGQADPIAPSQNATFIAEHVGGNGRAELDPGGRRAPDLGRPHLVARPIEA